MTRKRLFLFLVSVFLFQLNSFSQSLQDEWYIYTEYKPFMLEKVIDYNDLQSTPNNGEFGAYSRLSSSFSYAKKIEAWLRENGWVAPSRSEAFNKLSVRSSVYSVENKYGVDDTYLAKRYITINALSENEFKETLEILAKIEFKSGRFKISLNEPPLYILNEVRGTSFEKFFVEKRGSLLPEIKKTLNEIMNEFERFLVAEEDW